MPASPTKPAQIFILDTDTFSSLFRRDSNSEQIRKEIGAQPEGSIFLTAITAEESLRGALAVIRVEETRGKWGNGYLLLTTLIQELAKYPFLPYDSAADLIYRSFSASVKRAGSAYCKIAAIAQASNAIVITRNTRHFSTISGTNFTDWTQVAK